MKKFFLSFFVISAFIAYGLHQRNEQAQVQIAIPSSTRVPTALNSWTGSVNSAGAGSPIPQVVSSGFKDGSFTGQVADAFYGNIQVKAIIQNGKIVDVQFLQYPNDRDTSIQINTQAMPLLKREAIQNQSAQVDIISSATDSSNAFQQSLQSALNLAKS